MENKVLDTYKFNHVNFFLVNSGKFYVLEAMGYKFDEDLFSKIGITKEEFTSLGYSFHIDSHFCNSCGSVRYFSWDKKNFGRFFEGLESVRILRRKGESF